MHSVWRSTLETMARNIIFAGKFFFWRAKTTYLLYQPCAWALGETWMVLEEAEASVALVSNCLQCTLSEIWRGRNTLPAWLLSNLLKLGGKGMEGLGWGRETWTSLTDEQRKWRRKWSVSPVLLEITEVAVKVTEKSWSGICLTVKVLPKKV